MTQFLKENKNIIITGIIFFLLGFFSGDSRDEKNWTNKVLREGGYKYINPVLLCNVGANNQQLEDVSLRNKLQNYMEDLKEKDISVYFLSLDGNKWVGINENEPFSPASMLKVPTMVAYLRYAETNPEILSKNIYFDGSFDDNRAEYFKPQKSIQKDHYYTVNELMEYMIAYSDNNATRLLHNNIDSRYLQGIYSDLGIQLPTSRGIDFMSTKTYSLFLRLLYNATYINREMSEKVLKIMTARDFPKGLQAGVPEDVEVAQKFGEIEIQKDKGVVEERELHDCGVVYAKDSPYLLCVMTRGKDFDVLASEIAEISKIVYEYVTKK